MTVSVVTQGVEWIIFAIMLAFPVAMAASPGIQGALRGFIHVVQESVKKFSDAVSSTLQQRWVQGAVGLGLLVGAIVGLLAPTPPAGGNVGASLFAIGVGVLWLEVAILVHRALDVAGGFVKAWNAMMKKLGLVDVAALAMVIIGGILLGWALGLPPSTHPALIWGIFAAALSLTVIGWMWGLAFNSFLDDANPVGFVDELLSSLGLAYVVVRILRYAHII